MAVSQLELSAVGVAAGNRPYRKTLNRTYNTQNRKTGTTPTVTRTAGIVGATALYHTAPQRVLVCVRRGSLLSLIKNLRLIAVRRKCLTVEEPSYFGFYRPERSGSPLSLRKCKSVYAFLCFISQASAETTRPNQTEFYTRCRTYLRAENNRTALRKAPPVIFWILSRWGTFGNFSAGARATSDTGFCHSGWRYRKLSHIFYEFTDVQDKSLSLKSKKPAFALMSCHASRYFYAVRNQSWIGREICNRYGEWWNGGDQKKIWKHYHFKLKIKSEPVELQLVPDSIFPSSADIHSRLAVPPLYEPVYREGNSSLAPERIAGFVFKGHFPSDIFGSKGAKIPGLGLERFTC